MSWKKPFQARTGQEKAREAQVVPLVVNSTDAVSVNAHRHATPRSCLVHEALRTCKGQDLGGLLW